MTVTFESEVASVAKLVVAYRLHGVPANGRAPLHAPQDSGPRFGPDEAANLQFMMPVLIKQWPAAPMARKSAPSMTDSPAVAAGSMQDLKQACQFRLWVVI